RGRAAHVHPIQSRRRDRRRPEARAPRHPARGLPARPDRGRHRFRGRRGARLAVLRAVQVRAPDLDARARGGARGRVRGGGPMTTTNPTPAPDSLRRFWAALAALAVLALLSSVHSLRFGPLAARYRQLLHEAGEMGAPLDARLGLAPLPPRVTE